MPMETDIPTTTVTGGKKKGWTTGEKAGVCGAVIAAIALMIVIATQTSWSIGWKIGFCLAVIALLALICVGHFCKKRILSWLEKRRESNQRSADVVISETSEGAAEPFLHQSTDQIEMNTMRAGAPESETNLSAGSPNPAALNASSEEANGFAGGDQSSQSHQADGSGFSEGCGDGQAVEAENRDMATSDHKFYDIYLVSTSEQTPQFDMIKDMCRKNEWKFTTPFDGKLGVPAMQSVEEDVLTSSHVVFLMSEDDCSLKKDDFNISEIGGKVIPIRCCDKASLPLQLRCLEGATIDDDDLEERMKSTIGKGIRREGEAQCHSVSGALGVREGADEKGGADKEEGADEKGGADVAGGSDNASGCGDGQAVEAENKDMATSDQPFYGIYAVSIPTNTDDVKKFKDMCQQNRWILVSAPISRADGADVAGGSNSASAACSGNTVLT